MNDGRCAYAFATILGAGLMGLVVASGAAKAHPGTSSGSPSGLPQADRLFWSSAYNASSPESGTTAALAPFIQSRNGPLEMTSGLAVRNGGPYTATVNLTTRDADGHVMTGLDGMSVPDLAPGEPAWFWVADILSTGSWVTINKAHGSAQISSSQPVLVAVQDVSLRGSVDATLYRASPVGVDGPFGAEHAVPALLAGADGGGTTALIATNLDPDHEARMTLEVWPDGGGLSTVFAAPPVPPLQGAAFDLTSVPLTRSIYSAIVTSDRAASVLTRTDWPGGAAVNHDEVPLGDDIVVPLVVRNPSKECSTLAIQNVDPVRRAAVVMTFQAQAGGASIGRGRVIPARRSAMVALCDDPELAALPDGFAGSARIVSDGPSLGVTVVTKLRNGAAAYGFEGQPAVAAAPVLMAPLVNGLVQYEHGLPLLYSRIVVHNPGQTPVQVAVEYRGAHSDHYQSCASRQCTLSPVSVAPGLCTSIKVTSSDCWGFTTECTASAVITSSGGGVLAMVLDEGSAVEAMPTATPTEPPATATAVPTAAPYRVSLPIALRARGLSPAPGAAPGPLGIVRHGHTATLLADGRVLVAGGLPEEASRWAEVYDPVTGLWRRAADMAVGRHDHSAVRLVDGRVLVVGGAVIVQHGQRATDAVEIFDPSSDAWTAAAPLPGPFSSPSAVLLHDGRVMVIAGGLGADGSPRSAVHLYDPERDAWSAGPPLQHARGWLGAVVLADGRVLAVSSWLSNLYTTSCEIFDPATGAWSTTGDLNAGRGAAPVLLADGTVMVAGGLWGRPGPWAELFDPRSGTWTALPEPAFRRERHTTTLLADGSVLVAGGGDEVPSDYSERFDPRTRTWAPAPRLVWARGGHTATALPGQRVLIAGGAPEAWSPLRWLGVHLGRDSAFVQTEIFEERTGDWLTASPVPAGRLAHSLTSLSDGRLLMAGGTGTAGSLAQAAVLDAAAGAWTPVAAVRQRRTLHSATRLPDGSVLVAGGWSDGPLASVEVFGLAAGVWTTVPPLATARYAHTATGLPDGDVLVVGGCVAAGQYTHAEGAERYDWRSRSWRAAGALETSTCGHSATLLRDGTVLVAGGVHEAGAVYGMGMTARATRYDPATDRWRPAADMPQAAVRHSAALLPDGRVLVFGGWVEDPNHPGTATTESNLAWIYDPVADAWSTAPTSPVARVEQAFATLLDGTVVAIGGKAFRSTWNNVDAFDTVALDWRPLAALTEGRILHAAALLPDGRVVVVGGSGYREDAPLESMEVYDPLAGTWSPGPRLPAIR